MATPYMLTIAGLDPCGGAGILADIKTTENLNVSGLSTCTALTVQSDRVLKKCRWVDVQLITEQVELLMEHYPIGTVKIGIIENTEVITEIIRVLRDKKPDVRIIWDPVLKSGGGYVFHKKLKLRDLYRILDHCYLITPNYDEIRALSENSDVEKAIAEITARCHLLLKGGHRNDRKGTDILYRKGSSPVVFHPEKILDTDRHGSGCVLSSAIGAYLARGYTLEVACKQAKEYTYNYLKNSPGGNKLKGVEFQYISRGITPEEHLNNIRSVCTAGGRWIQLRIKDRHEREVFDTAKKALKICRQYGARLIIDDYVSTAKAVGADGVHLGKNDLPAGEAKNILGPGFIVGATANTIEDIELQTNSGADYIGLGPYRFTSTKKNLSPVLGLEGYLRIVQQLQQRNINIPLVAIGGITREDIAPILDTGIQGIAVSGLLSAPGRTDLKATITEIQHFFKNTEICKATL